MRGFVIAAGLFVGMVVLFFVGMLSAQPGMSMAMVCVIPFGAFTIGWTAKGMTAGRRLQWVDARADLPARRLSTAEPRRNASQGGLRRITNAEAEL